VAGVIDKYCETSVRQNQIRFGGHSGATRCACVRSLIHSGLSTTCSENGKVVRKSPTRSALEWQQISPYEVS
jgi:hypothetical protein